MKLSRYQKKMIELRIEGYSSHEIAEKMEISLASVYSQFSRMRKNGIMIKKETRIKKTRDEKVLFEFEKGRSVKEICKLFNISQQTFYRIKRNKENTI